MFEYSDIKHRLIADSVFILMIALFYGAFRFGLPISDFEIGRLFLATFLFLGLSITFLLFTKNMNPRLASLSHILVFPILSNLFLILKWLPNILNEFEVETLKITVFIVVYEILLVVFLIIQIYIHKNKTKTAQESNLKKN